MQSKSEIYREKLKSPIWQAVRRLVFARDNYACQNCSAEREWGYVLEVHHKRYISGREPWEYPSSYLVTLCSKCHRNIHGFDYIEPNSSATKTVSEIMKELKKGGIYPWLELEI